MISRRAFALAVPATATLVRSLRAAEVDGRWEAEIEGPRGTAVYVFDLKAEGEKLTGTIGNDMMGAVGIQEGTISGDQIEFVQVMQRGDFEMRFKFVGKIAGDAMELTRTVQRPGGPGGGRQRGGQSGGGPGGAQGGRQPGGAPGGGRGAGGQGGAPGGRRGMGRPMTFTAKRVM